MSNPIISEYDQLEIMQDEFNRIEKEYYQARYKFWNMIAKVKKLSPLKESYKNYEGKVRRDVKKKLRQNYYGKRPRGTELDHKKPVLYYFVLGETDLEIINSRDNCKFIPKKDNRQKGIKRDK
jgi:hypothetical protein